MLDGSTRSKLLFLLTATPVNNRLADFRHMAELFTRGDEAFFGRSLGVNHLSGHFNVMERDLQATLGAAGGSNGNGSGDISGRAAMALAEGLTQEARDALATDVVFGALVVQRSRSYAKASQIQERGESAAFPERKPPQVGRVLDPVVVPGTCSTCSRRPAARQNPLFSLAIY